MSFSKDPFCEGKEENAYPQFSFFLLMFSTVSMIIPFFSLSQYVCYLVNKSRHFFDKFKALTLAQRSPGFYVFAVQVFCKHCTKRRNFSFPYSIFYPFGELSDIFIKSEIVTCKLFQSGNI